MFGVLTLIFAEGRHRGMRRTRAGIAGPVMLGISRLGLVLAALYR